jgi:phosphoribosyl-ATP pyrophosphohydrolase
MNRSLCNRSMTIAAMPFLDLGTAMTEQSIVLDVLAVIADRKSNPSAERSYVSTLLQAGVAKTLGKISEEAAEVVAAASEPGDEGRAHLVREAADLVFHTLVLLGRFDVSWHDVEAELAQRFGVSGIVEKESRPATG